LRTNPIVIKLNKAKESVRLCKINIENQEIKLDEANEKIAIIQSKISSIDSNPSDKLEKFININNKLILNVELHKGIILELQQDLNINENNLKQLKSKSICSMYL